MAKYIDYDLFKKDLEKRWDVNDDSDFANKEVWHALEEAPAADVRPVVLCRDCIHFQQFRPHDGFCKIDGMLWNNDFFCANGKREES